MDIFLVKNLFLLLLCAVAITAHFFDFFSLVFYHFFNLVDIYR